MKKYRVFIAWAVAFYMTGMLAAYKPNVFLFVMLPIGIVVCAILLALMAEEMNKNLKRRIAERRAK